MFGEFTDGAGGAKANVRPQRRKERKGNALQPALGATVARYFVAAKADL